MMFEREIKAKKTDLLYQHGQNAIIAMLLLSVLAVCFVYYVIWPVDKSMEFLLVWQIMFFLVSGIRLYGVNLYKNNNIANGNSVYWFYAYIAGIAVSGCMWSVFFLYHFLFINPEYRIIILVIILGLVSTEIAIYATSMAAFLTAASTILLPVISYLITDDHESSSLLGGMLIFYLVYLLIITRQLNNTLAVFISHEFNIARLEQEKNYTVLVNKELEEEITKRINTEGKLKEEKHKAEALADKLITISSKDGLTGICNRRRFNEYLENEWNRAARTNKALSLIICDIDYYKAYNDSYGHLAGDDCLKKIAVVLEHHARRASDMAARYGGEEFVVLLPDTSSEQATRLAEQIRVAVENLQVLHKSSDVSDHVTVSLGVATLIPQQNYKPDILINLADKALYKAKHGGRNRVVTSQ